MNFHSDDYILTILISSYIIYRERFLWKKFGKIYLGYEGYQASNLGRIRTYNKITYNKKHGYRHWKNRILKYKSKDDKTGYRVSLWKNGKHKDFLVARLVATTFLDNFINTKMTINHKDGNRMNNNIENLEWCTRAENIRYGFEHNQYPQIQTILINSKTNEKFIFKSMSSASRFLHRNNGYIYNCFKKGRKITSKDNTLYYLKIKKP